MNSIEMIVVCAQHQDGGSAFKCAVCIRCGEAILYNWFRTKLCARCDLLREFNGEPEENAWASVL